MITGIEVDADGSVFAADSGERSIQKFDSDGIYLYPTINLSDYETTLLRVRLPRQESEGPRTVARLNVSYTDVEGERQSLDPMYLTLHFVPAENPVDGISDATVLKAGTVLSYAQALKRIGGAYYSGASRNALEMTNQIKKEVMNAQQRLGSEDFEDEIVILQKYITILGKNIGYSETNIGEIIADKALKPVSRDRGLFAHLHNLLQEVAFDLRSRQPGSIAVLGYNVSSGGSPGMVDLLDKTAESLLFDIPQYSVLERERVHSVMEEQQLSLSDLMETTRAVRVGRMLTAQYVLLGNIVEMSESVVVFSRVINVETGIIESVAQVIIPKDEDVSKLL